MASSDEQYRDEKLDLANFLANVDELESIVKGMGAEDENTRKEAIKKADDVLRKKETTPTPINKTIINKDAYKNDPSTTSAGGMAKDQEGFMKYLEHDAEARAQRRKERTDKATVWKDKGNEAFKCGDYEKAIECYTSGMEIMKDYSALFTNRAQAYIKIGEYDKAIADCDFAFRIDKECVKAYIHKGRAYLAKKEYDDAIKTYEEILEFNPKKEKLVKEYVTAARQAKEAAEAEEKVQQLFQEGNEELKTVAEVLEKLKKEGQQTLYYSGGCRLLTAMLIDDVSRTVFRSHNGFQILMENKQISKCLQTLGKMKNDQIDLCGTVLDLFTSACKDNEENQKTVFSIEGFTDQFCSILEHSPHKEIQHSCVQFVYTLSQSEFGRKMVITNVGGVRTLVGMLTYARTFKTSSNDAITTLNNLAMEKRFLRAVYDGLEESVIPAIEKLLKDQRKMSTNVFVTSLSFIGTLANETAIRKKLSSSKGFWEGCVQSLSLQKEESVIVSLLGLMMNLSLETSESLNEMSVQITKAIQPLLQHKDNDIQERSYGLLSRVIGNSDECKEIACQQNIPKCIIQLLPKVALICQRHAIKCLTILTQSNKTARYEVTENDKDLSVLRDLLTSDDSIIVANTALCIGHCSEDPSVSSNLVKTDIIKQLLAKTDTVNSAIKENCAIAVAKLVTTDKQHLERLHELHGMDILHSCMKHVKLS
ncbi:tetratricopeptide repeat protein 12-like [Glandiceps talaboti]